ncbi:hypothetical protein [Stieleria varia]|uniref:Uncharacterized protein n=1 Tax=Stieleria varia TaxID=2528005 RepID=A0A5C6AYY8_9BACT|nr:hypothetical protein [Stieleria varia]TWU04342.1 hypothetical protein Pla52n_23820 [Stieleria varia]
MRLPKWIWKTNIAGTVAVFNMLVIAACAIAHMTMFPDGVVRVDTEPQWKLSVSDAMGWVVVAFTFPFGWFVEMITGGVSKPPIFAPFYVPVNAYLWGAFASRFQLREVAPEETAVPEETARSSERAYFEDSQH